jgi:Arc/MetJ-type ribon-helix-helix transcriptional regulator
MNASTVLREACTEMRQCHERIDSLLAANPEAVDQGLAAEWRKQAAESTRALEAATARVLGRIAGQEC